MVEDNVQDDAHAFLVGLRYQIKQISEVAKMRIDFQKVLNPQP
jgi:hypothetical protein